MASIEAMTKEATRSLTIRVRRQKAANKELEAAQDMDRRAVSRLDAAEKAKAALDEEVTSKVDLVSRLTGKTAEDVLAEITAELEKADESTDSGASGDAPADENQDADQVSAPVKKAPAKKTAAKPETVSV